MNCRGLRLEWVAGLSMALALPALLAAAAPGVATQTSLNVETSDQSGHTQATATITVTGVDGTPASGIVLVEDGSRQLAEAALNGNGQATAAMSLPTGNHTLRAVYTGDASHLYSASPTSGVTAQASSTRTLPSPSRPSPPPLCLSRSQTADRAPLPSLLRQRITRPSQRPCSSRSRAQGFPLWPRAPLRLSPSRFFLRRRQAVPPVLPLRLARLSVPC